MRIWLLSASILGGLAVLFVAFAAHGLSGRLTPDALGWFETGARYQMYHALAMGLAALSGDTPHARRAAFSFLVGVLLFSGSLYAMALTGITGLGIITPLGGLAFLAGWVFLGLAAMARR